MSQGPGQLKTFEPLRLVKDVLILLIKEVQLRLPILQGGTDVPRSQRRSSLSLKNSLRQIWTVSYALGLPHTNAWNWSLSTWCISNAVAQASFKCSSRTAAAGENITPGCCRWMPKISNHHVHLFDTYSR